MENQEFIEKARAEILNPTFEITKQYLEVMEVELENGLPKVERINLDLSENIVAVYFPIKNERFFLEIHLTKKPKIEIDFSWVQSGHQVYLTAVSEELSFEELSADIEFGPLEGWSKEQLRPVGGKPYSFSRISYEPIKSEAYGLEEKLSLLLTELEKHTESVQKLTKRAEAYISVCRNQCICANAGIHFDIETIHRMSALNLEIDIDTYIVGEPLK